ncbi:hypothetical protein D922_01910 [Enterococcus faecalis 06-MB-DW-09]|nr:hypothetical protein D931_01510 [Enterococcus faecium 13.SD.W.09]EPH93369.1 hypothetical protein D922_01910 [Enterococcus faecalis 06-MB-DW-09]
MLCKQEDRIIEEKQEGSGSNQKASILSLSFTKSPTDESGIWRLI